MNDRVSANSGPDNFAPYYEDDSTVIYQGDCREIVPTLDASCFVVTDPPYGVAIETNNVSRSRRARGRDFPPVHGDDAPFDPAHLLRFKRCVLFGANNYASRLPDKASWIVWDRKSGDSNTADCELAWTNLGGTVRIYRHLWNGVLRDSEIGQHYHPTQKPVTMFRWILSKWAKPGDVILDPYMGSGSILRAAKDLGFRSIGIEIEPAYCEVAANRLSQEVLNLGA